MIKRIRLRALAAVVGLPLLVLLVAIVWISLLDRTNGRIVSDGEEREYLLHVVYPSGTPELLGLARIWHTMPGAVDRDVRFIARLIDTLQAAFNIDPARIFANGMSNGGGMVFALSCAMSDRIAAVALVAAAQQLAPSWCADSHPVPLLAFHGDADSIVPYNGGPLGDPFNPVKPVYPPVRDWVAAWAVRNRCAAAPADSTIAGDALRREYRDCAAGAAVVLYTLLGGGHSWLGGKPPPRWRVGATNTSIDATGEMWRFFLRHPQRPQR